MQIFFFFEVKNKDALSRQEFATFLPSFLTFRRGKPKLIRSFEQRINLQTLLPRERRFSLILTIYFELIEDKTMMEYRYEK